MADSMRVRASLQDGVTSVKCLMNHPMESGLRKDRKTGEMVPAHFITEVSIMINGKSAATQQWGVGVSKNPYLEMRFTGCKVGDLVTITWIDNQGGKDTVETKVV